MVTVDTRPPDHHDSSRGDPERRQGVAVFGVLHNDPAPLSSRRETQRDAQRRPPQSRGKARGREPGPQTHYRIDRHRSTFRGREGAAQSDAAEQHRFECDMMDNIGPFGAIEPRNFGNGPPRANQPVAAPPPADRTQRETFVADPIAMRAHARRDHDIEAGCPGGARRRPTVRAEVPILGDEKNQLWPPRRAGRREASRQVQRFCDNGHGHVETLEAGIGTAISLTYLRRDWLDNRRGRRGEGGAWLASW